MKTLDLAHGDARATVIPERGGMITRWTVAGRDVLYLDPATVEDRSKSVRGGVPILFPSPGKLAGDAWARAGRRGAMKQHGFARDLAWTVVRHDAHAATLAIAATDATLAAYPWRFRVEMTYALEGSTLRLDHAVENAGDEPMPFAFGFHPYFQVADKSRAWIPTSATRAFDNVRKQTIDFGGFDFSAGEVDMHLVDHGQSRAEIGLGDGARVRLEGSPEYGRWVVWSLPGKSFVCLEPWTAPGDALNTGESLIDLAPGARRAMSLAMTFAAQ